jgi:cytochrome c-type biogenesis protein CcmE
MCIRAKVGAFGVMITASLAYVVYLLSASNWQYYLQVDEFVSQSAEFHGKRLRVSGRVAADSLEISTEHRETSFVLEGSEHKLPVCYLGSIPDNLAEGRDVVVEGTLVGDGPFRCDTLITRCASKYAPKEMTGMAGQTTQVGTEE